MIIVLYLINLIIRMLHQIILNLFVNLQDLATRQVDDSLKKKHYLQVAVAMMKQDKKPQRALQLIKDSDGALTIQVLTYSLNYGNIQN